MQAVGLPNSETAGEPGSERAADSTGAGLLAGAVDRPAGRPGSTFATTRSIAQRLIWIQRLLENH